MQPSYLSAAASGVRGREARDDRIAMMSLSLRSLYPKPPPMGEEVGRRGGEVRQSVLGKVPARGRRGEAGEAGCSSGWQVARVKGAISPGQYS